jgi:DNA-binding MarR family transcriptional regulator
MSKRATVSFEATIEVRDTCLCLYLQRAARVIARHFDEALRPFDLTNGQFSLLMSLNRPEPPSINQVSATLGMDRTTLTANLKPLERRDLLTVSVDEEDKRGRRLALTAAGHALLMRALPVWKSHHAAIEHRLKRSKPEHFREDLRALS